MQIFLLFTENFRLTLYKSQVDNKEQIALVKGKIDPEVTCIG